MPRFFQKFPSFKQTLKAWDEGASSCAKEHPLKVLQHLPDMPAISTETARFLKFKTLKYLIAHDTKKILPRLVFKNPLKHTLRFFLSLLHKKSYIPDEDFFLYGLKSTDDFKKELQKKDTLLVVGFSYCHKPFECPSKRFSPHCIHDANHPVCRQCFIGKSINLLPEEGVIPLSIPTIHYIGEKILKIAKRYPKRNILFLITACELTLEMFGDYGNMAGVKGIGVRLKGRICNTMKAFELSEKGIKPGLTVVDEATQERILSLLSSIHTNVSCERA